MAKQPLEELFSVTIRQAPEVAKLLKTTAPKVKAMILNHTLPIGCVSEGAEGEVDRVIIIEERLRAWLNAEDLKGGRRLKHKGGTPMIKKLTGLNMGCKELAVSILKSLGLLAILYGTYWIGMFALNYMAAMLGGTGT